MKGILYLQSSYSMLKNMIPLESLFLVCQKEGYEFIALTDEQLHGTYDLFKNAKKYNLRPILGMVVDILEPNETKFLIYVKNSIGYENLLNLSKMKANGEKLSLKDLINNQKGLIFVSGGYNSVIDQTALYGNETTIKDYLISYKNNFDDFYVGINFNYEIQKNYSTKLINKLAINNNIKTLPIHQTSYLHDEDKSVLETLLKIENNKNEILEDANFKMLSLNEINNLYKDYSNVEKDLQFFLNSINFELTIPKFNLPIYETPENINGKDYLKSLARVGLKRRLQLTKIKDDTNYIKRLEHELDIITNMSFENYFLVVYDFIKYAKDNKILVGPGRGSAAGSLVSYCLGITNIDPIKYGLMFERFLNPARMSMPDIDIDFPDNKREQVINYVKEKYGNNHICSITTYSSFAERSSIRDVARVLEVPSGRLEGIIKSILSNNVDETDYESMAVLNTSKKIEGLYRQTGTHAAGIILSNEDLTKYIPMQQGAYSFNQAQFDAATLEALGLNKIDFLGIRNLTIIDDIILELRNKNINIDINNINLNDNKTFDLLSKADTSGLFQLESDGMRNVLRKLKPNSFNDIVATLALYRPGPMENIDEYIERRNGKKFNYLHKDLEPVLKETYGIIIYQEQIMEIARVFAGYNLFDADMLRVGVSKKDLKILESERTKFVKGSLKQGYSLELANEIYDYIVRFADYGFNKSHSVSYGLVSYQMAYLKANYYTDFVKVLLNHVIGNVSQTNSYIKEALNNNIVVLPPHLNYSTNKYEVVNNAIIMPLTSIKGFGLKVTEEILKVRETKSFDTFMEVKERMADLVSQVQFNNLIYAGALDFIKLNRKTLISNSDLSNIGYEKYIKDFKIAEEEDYSFNDNMINEKLSLGFNLKYDLITLIDNLNPNQARYLKVSDLDPNKEVSSLIGFISNIKEYTSKNGSLMYFITITDGLNDLDITVFSNAVEKFKEMFNDKLSIFLVKKNNYQGRTTYILDNIANL